MILRKCYRRRDGRKCYKGRQVKRANQDEDEDEEEETGR